METLAAPIPFTQTVEIGSLALAMATERARRFMVAWQEALKALAHQVSRRESYIQTAGTAVAVGDPEAAYELHCTTILDLAFCISDANEFNTDNYSKKDLFSVDEFKNYIADIPFDQKWKLIIKINESNEQ